MGKSIFILGITLVVAAFLLMDWLIPLYPRVTAANVRRINVKMTLKDVEAILGNHRYPLPSGEGITPYVWVSRSGCAYVAISDDTGLVLFVDDFYEPGDSRFQHYTRVYGYPPTPSLPVRIRSWLGW